MDLKLSNNNKLSLYPFIKLEYIECTGTQYINTGISFTGGYKAELALTFSNNTGRQCIFGNYNGSTADTLTSSGRSWYLEAQGKVKYTRNVIDTNTLYKVTASITNNVGNLKMNEVTLLSNASYPGTTYVNLVYYLFAQNCSGSAGNYFKGKLFYIKLYDENNILKFNGQPAIDDNGVICIYDYVSEQFFYNQGSGVFNAGPVSYNTIPSNNILLCSTLFNKNTPRIDGYNLLKLAINYQKNNQDIVKEKYYLTTELWSNIITSYPEIVQYYNVNHKLCVLICEANDPEQYVEDFLQIIEDYPELAPITNNPAIVELILEWNPIIHSLINTGYENALESTGTQYIDTGFKLTHNISFDLDYQLSEIKPSVWFFGSATQHNGQGIFSTNFNTGLFVITGNSGKREYSIATNNTNRHKIIYKAVQSLNFDGTITALSANTFTSGNNCILFGCYSVNTITKQAQKIYSFVVYDNDTKIKQLVPFYRNGHYGMIDLVNLVFYPNAGTGEFIYSCESKS